MKSVILSLFTLLLCGMTSVSSYAQKSPLTHIDSLLGTWELQRPDTENERDSDLAQLHKLNYFMHFAKGGTYMAEVQLTQVEDGHIILTWGGTWELQNNEIVRHLNMESISLEFNGTNPSVMAQLQEVLPGYKKELITKFFPFKQDCTMVNAYFQNGKLFCESNLLVKEGGMDRLLSFNRRSK